MGCGCNKKGKKTEARIEHKTVNTTGSPPYSVGSGAAPKEKHKFPSVGRQIFNFAKAATNYVRSGMDNVSESEYHVRLSICNDCPFRKDSKCSKCGCYIETKARWATSTCPDERWPNNVKK